MAATDDLFAEIPETGITASQWRKILADNADTLAEAFRQGVNVENLVRGRAQMVDQVLARIWKEALGRYGDQLALIAVGGYGRGELFPYSDVDILILHHPGDLDTAGPDIEAFLTLMWDIGLDVGHSVRTATDCANQARDDVTVITNMLESRCIAGNTLLHEQMQFSIAPDAVWPVREFFEAKLEEQRQRHAKYRDSAYTLEPNVKESPGSLRDFHTIAWVAMRHFGTHTLQELVDEAFLTEREYDQLVALRAHMWKVRYALHMVTQRAEDRLLFDHQMSVAKLFGYTDESQNRAIEQFMQLHYRRIKALSCLNDMLLQIFRDAILYSDNQAKPEVINDHFQSRHGYIEVRDLDLFEKHPIALLEIFTLLQNQPELEGIHAKTLRLIRHHRDRIDAEFRADPKARNLFISIFHTGSGATRTLRLLNRYGLLGRYIPAFGDVIGMMQYDLFHTLTVDEHTLFVVRNMRRLMMSRFDDELPYISRVAQTLEKPVLLYLAGLFHDIAKGRGGDHSELGAEDARQFCLDHSISSDDTELVCWLVENHLLMSLTAQKSDLGDPQIIHDFAQKVGSQSKLDYLLVMTVSDIRGTNPKLWNSWRESLLIELYEATSRDLARGAPIAEQELIHETRGAARNELKQLGLPEKEIENVWARLDDDYFLRMHVEEIVWQTQIIANNKDMPLVHVENLENSGTNLFIHTLDQDYLFGLTTAVLAQQGVSILDARINSTTDGYTLDSYVLSDEDGNELSDLRRDNIKHSLQAVIADPKVSKLTVSRRISRRLKHFNTPTQITFRQDKPNGRTIMEIVAADQPGLLSIIGRVFRDNAVLVAAAKIGTIGERAEDVFFITNAKHKAITRPFKLTRLRNELIEALEDQGDNSNPTVEI